ncbi:hypothetical protein KDD30_03710 [Photobacterium sp. GJ3]|uniref:hypothetical protein n=1 Tax=Photobacterium sp. GJ3 TaxID=2829502 RepID=UPI001B8D0615|nr:hypothetical protein [Photobacterium sp. GJ3]QUJ68257.1 hypothetical protein KDD30_03710 [Photobacterium sp. GJ3]
MSKFTDRPFIEFSDQTVKYRRNLLFISTILITLEWFPTAKIVPDKPFLGIPISGLELQDIAQVLCAVIAYQIIHFVWRVTDEWWSWRIQLAGTKEKDQNGKNDSSHIKVISQICQFTYHPEHSSVESRINEVLKNRLKYFDDEVQKLGLTDEVVQTYKQQVEDVVLHSSGLAHEIERIHRFEQSIRGFSIQQQLRFHLLEIGLPIALSIIAIVLVLTDNL